MHAFQEQNNGQSDYFVTVFDAHGNIRYSTYLGGSGVEGTPGSVFADDSSNGNNVAADAAGLVYVTGTTRSGSGEAIKFPVTPNALQNELGGSGDAFLCIIDPAKSGADSLVYSSFLGGHGDDKGHSVAVDARGRRITVAGYTSSSNFPTTANAYRSHAAPAGYDQQRLCDPDPIKPARYPVLPVHDALLHVPGGGHERRPRRHIRHRLGSKGAHRGHGPDAVGGLSDDQCGAPPSSTAPPISRRARLEMSPTS